MRLVPVCRAGVPTREWRVAHGQRLGPAAELVEPFGQVQDAIDVGGEDVARGAALGDRLVVGDGAVTVEHGGEGAAGLRGAPAARQGLLQDEDPGAGVVRCYRRGGTSSAVAGDDHVIGGRAIAVGLHDVTMMTLLSPVRKAVPNPASLVMRC